MVFFSLLSYTTIFDAIRKDAFCTRSDRGETKKRILPQRLTKNRSLVGPRLAECAFP